MAPGKIQVYVIFTEMMQQPQVHEYISSLPHSHAKFVQVPHFVKINVDALLLQENIYIYYIFNCEILYFIL
jgi:hypothetical protein